MPKQCRILQPTGNETVNASRPRPGRAARLAFLAAPSVLSMAIRGIGPAPGFKTGLPRLSRDPAAGLRNRPPSSRSRALCRLPTGRSACFGAGQPQPAGRFSAPTVVTVDHYCGARMLISPPMLAVPTLRCPSRVARPCQLSRNSRGTRISSSCAPTLTAGPACPPTGPAFCFGDGGFLLILSTRIYPVGPARPARCVAFGADACFLSSSVSPKVFSHLAGSIRRCPYSRLFS